jgi:RimJ/RimL family protein N-acetyltransferase
MIVGQRVRLRPIERSDLSRFVGWFADPEVCAHLALVLGPGLAQEEEWFEAMLARPALEQPLAVEARAGEGEWRHVGSAGFEHLDWRNRSVEIGLVLGDTSSWGQGLGTEVTELLLRQAFATLNLHRVWLRVYEDHDVARHVYEKVGFVLEGVQRDGDFRLGRYRGVRLYSILRHEWLERIGKQAPTSPAS